MKAKIIKKLITKNGYFDRERLITIIERGILSHFFCFAYRKFLKINIKRINRKTSDLEKISNCFSGIGSKSKLKAFFRKKRGFKAVKTLVLFKDN
jgi:hypothetical protein